MKRMTMLRVVCGALMVAGLGACGDGDEGGQVQPSPDTGIAPPDIVGQEVVDFDTQVAETTAEADSAVPDGGDTAEAGDTSGADTSETPDGADCRGFECPCQTNGDCINELCVEGPDGRICTETCISTCDEGYDCVSSTAFGSDPISICLPQHTRLCRPCQEDSDCQDPSDPLPSYCLPGPVPGEGSFCGSSCASRGCPSGYACESVALTGGGTASQCIPESGATCACRPSWDGLGFVTNCDVKNGFGTCQGARTCGEFGLTPCQGPQATAEICNDLDDDCDGTPDNIAATPCQVQNLFGTCEGVTACGELGPICEGDAAQPEACDGVNNDCDGETDEDSCDDGLSCTTDVCTTPFNCNHTLSPGFCAINGSCYAAGAANVNNPCDVCNPAQATDAWTQATNTCVIAGQCFPNGGVDPNNACQICDVSRNTTAWSVTANTCTIGGVCYLQNAVNTASPCQICDPGRSTTAWSQATNTCDIQGTCYASGASKPGAPCLKCDPTRNATGWSPALTNTVCDDGSPCSTDDHCNAAGECVGDTQCNDGVPCTTDDCTASGCDHSGVRTGWCQIGRGCYTTGTAHPVSACEWCAPATSTRAWSPKPNNATCSDNDRCTVGDHCDGAGRCVPGTGCGDGLSCTDDNCDPQVGCSYPITGGKCKINDACYSNNDLQPGNVCYKCNSGSPTSWSLNNGHGCDDGNSCTRNDDCSNGSCAGDPIQDADEANQSLGAAKSVGSIDDGDGWPADQHAFTANLYPAGDEDWYSFRLTDKSNAYQPHPTVELSGIPAGLNYDLCMYWRCDDPGREESIDCETSGNSASTWEGRPGCCSRKTGTQTEFIEMKPNCDNSRLGADDETGTAYIRIFRVSGSATCANYTLKWGND